MSDLERLKDLMGQRENLDSEKIKAVDSEKDLSGRIENIDAEILELLVSAGLQNIKSESGRMYFRKREQYVGKSSDVDKDRFIAVLANSPQFSSLVTPSYNSMSLRSRYNEVLDTGEEIPEEVQQVLKITEVTKLGVRKS